MGAVAVPTPIPFDLTQEGALNADWRGNFRWPLPASRLYRIHSDLWERVSRLAGILDPEARDIVLLGRPAALGALVEAAYIVEAEGSTPYLHGPVELEILRGARKPDGSGGAGHHGKTGTLRHRTLRQIARTASWSTAVTLLPNLLAPKGIALSHNSLLRSFIKRTGARVGYRHGDAYLADRLDSHPPVEAEFDIETIVERFLADVITFDDLSGDITERLRDIVRPQLRDSLAQAASTLAALRAAPRLPQSVWTGTGAGGPGRAIGLEVLRRGGEVWRFDHGGTAALSDAYAPFAINELCVSSHVVMPTPAIAATEKMEKAKALAAPIRSSEILGHDGDPGLDVGATAFRDTRRERPRRRVLYVSTAFYGFYQTSTPVMPGVPYLEWQIRLVEALQKLPIDLTCKPHPEGLLRGKVPPVDAMATVSTAPFEQALTDTDILIMDIPASTTFSIALTTDRPIVFFDFGLLPFNASVAGPVAKRCRVLTPGYTDTNQPQIDEAALAEAVCGGDDVADPSFFRTLFLGAEA